MSKGDIYLANSIKAIRKEYSLSQKDLADILGVRKTTVCNYESCYSTPKIEIYRKLCKSFNKPMEYFISGVDIKEKIPQEMVGVPVPFFNNANADGILEGDCKLKNSLFMVPFVFVKSKSNIISTFAPDNSLNNCGIHTGDAIFLDKTQSAEDNSLIGAVKNGVFIIRRYHDDSDGIYLSIESSKVPARFSKEEMGNDYKYVGRIIKVLSDAR